MDTKTKETLRKAINTKMADLGLTWDFTKPEWSNFPVSSRTIYSICDNTTYNISLETLVKVCNFLKLKYTIDGNVLKIKE